MKVTTVIFDLDGTLIDSSQGILDSLFKAMEHFSIKPAITKLDSHFFMGKSLTETLRILMPDQGPETLKKIGDHYVSHYSDNYMDKAVTFDGVADTIKKLHKKGYTLAVATAKHTYCAEAELTAAGIRDYFTELLFRICRELDTDPSDVLMVGDTDRDVLIGRNAGTFTVAVTYGGWPKERFINENIIPDIFVDSFSELLEHL
jgi:phosphoglycolate phosphatase-like HAD superfamily hydrolase